MTGLDRGGPFEVASVHELAPDCADPPFDERVRAGRAYRGTDRPDAFGVEHLVERRRELAAPVADQESDRLRSVDERVDDVACLLGRPLTRRVGHDAREIDPPGREL